LVGGFNHLEKYESQWEGLSHILWKIKMFETTNQLKKSLPHCWKPPNSGEFLAPSPFFLLSLLQLLLLLSRL